MDAKDTDKLHEALAGLTNLDADLSNFAGRSARAGKAWATWAKDPNRSKEQVAAMKAVLAALTKMGKDAKALRSDITKIGKSAGDQKVLAAHPTAKSYRDKVLVKQLAGLKKWAQTGAEFEKEMKTVVPPFRHPNAKGVDEVVTYDSVTNFVARYKQMNDALAKL
jgi:hypothetical protein